MNIVSDEALDIYNAVCQANIDADDEGLDEAERRTRVQLAIQDTLELFCSRACFVADITSTNLTTT